MLFSKGFIGKSLIVGSIAVVMLFTALLPLYGKSHAAYVANNTAAESFELDDVMYDAVQGGNYDDYLRKHAAKESPDTQVLLPAEDYGGAEGMQPEKLADYEGQTGVSVRTGEQGSIFWDAEVEQEGMYRIAIQYYPVEGKSSSIQRALLIDGEVPFSEAAQLEFHRVWGNARDSIAQDDNGNDLRPEQAEHPSWQEEVLKDAQGFHEEPFAFYFSKGRHRITLISQREPMVIGQIKLLPVHVPLPYEQLKASYDPQDRDAAQGTMLEIQGERPLATSSPTLYPLSDRSSPAVTPYNAAKIKINTIGGNNWRVPGEWIEWNVDVPKTGLYKIGLHVKQNLLRGLNSTRILRIDGEIPFKEAANLKFAYGNDWRLEVLGRTEEPYLFHLTEGKHVLRLEVALGDMAPSIRKAEQSLLQLNEAYRRILMITGSIPDPMRDYQLEKKLPGLLDTFQEESDRLKAVSIELEQQTGKRSDKQAVLETLADQLADFTERPETIHKRLDSFKANIGALGTWMLSVKELPLEIDSIYIASPSDEFPAKGASFWAKLLHMLIQFFMSFVINYDEIGKVTDGSASKSITVWIGSGRDQAQVIRSMLDDSFTPETGIKVNLKLIQMDVLLPATVSGEGPDVAMNVDNSIPVNFSMRQAVADLSGFPGFQEVAKRFRSSAMVPFQYEKGFYALPETQTYNMLFYRKDIMKELEQQVPQTWQELAGLIPVLGKRHMEFGLPQPVASAPGMAGQNLEPNAMFAMLLLQNNGEFYADGGKLSALDSETSMRAFRQWTEYYTDYRLTPEYDFANRFRTGEMPIGIADFTMYNQLAVFAPEIRGLWGFVPVPGTRLKDGTIRRDVPGGGSAVMMMKQAKDKEAAWTFMQWWTSEAVQTKFGREMEGLMGAAARYPTANLEAFNRLPWPVEDYKQLSEQSQWVQGIPEVPGGYFTGRHLINAFYSVINNGVEPREALEESVQYIKAEMKHKRNEFNLPE
ncbi:extracellular solute-binding protein [Paenibacillus sp. GCM10027626]|uniref:extracellular solute-binding protein n=1 Tax=Paenibacillus sp. GCM10027626 TaxID=3273411 RepID=UPI00363303E2